MEVDAGANWEAYASEVEPCVGLDENGREGKWRQGSSDSLEEDGKDPCSLLDRVGQDGDTLGDNEEARAEDEA